RFYANFNRETRKIHEKNPRIPRGPRSKNLSSKLNTLSPPNRLLYDPISCLGGCLGSRVWRLDPFSGLWSLWEDQGSTESRPTVRGGNIQDEWSASRRPSHASRALSPDTHEMLEGLFASVNCAKHFVHEILPRTNAGLLAFICSNLAPLNRRRRKIHRPCHFVVRHGGLSFARRRRRDEASGRNAHAPRHSRDVQAGR